MHIFLLFFLCYSVTEVPQTHGSMILSPVEDDPRDVQHFGETQVPPDDENLPGTSTQDDDNSTDVKGSQIPKVYIYADI